jgi:hypothetical protein
MADRRREGNEKSWPARAVLVRGDQRYRGGAPDGDADDHVCKHRVKEFSLSVHLRIVGWAATAVLLLAPLAFIASGIRGLF